MAAELVVDLQQVITATEIPPADALQRWAAMGYRGNAATEVTLRIVDEAESAELNGRYRGRDYPTNVLSFPFQAPPGIKVPLLGDLVICAPVVLREALEQGKAFDAHWAHMVIHGLLHLQGFDHENETDAGVMETLEIQLLARLNFPNPYDSEELEPDS